MSSVQLLAGSGNTGRIRGQTRGGGGRTRSGNPGSPPSQPGGAGGVGRIGGSGIGSGTAGGGLGGAPVSVKRASSTRQPEETEEGILAEDDEETLGSARSLSGRLSARRSLVSARAAELGLANSPRRSSLLGG